MKVRTGFATCMVMALATAVIPPASAQGPVIAPAPEVSPDGTIVTPSFELPFSSFASEEAKRSFVERLNNPMPIVRDIVETRRISDERMQPMIDIMKQTYPVRSARSEIAGVPVDIYDPMGGVSDANANKVLINLHGGGFVTGGGGAGGAVESIPIASLGNIRVISVDYRLAPENTFPAASEDVAAVYRELLNDYEPRNIGIYGCSAGGTLTAQSVPWFLKENLPLPGALGVFCASMFTFAEGDSAQLWTRMGSVIRMVPPSDPKAAFREGSAYTAGQSVDDPLVVPGASEDIMRQFPPTLLLTGLRASEASGAAQSALELQRLGVETQLSLFDGLDHGFFSDPNLPESQVAYTLITDFFDRHLGDEE